MKNGFIILMLMSLLFSAKAAIEPADSLVVAIVEKDTFVIEEDNPALLAMDMAMADMYFNINPLVTDTNLLDTIGQCSKHVPSYNDAYFAEYLSKLDSETPFELIYNNKVQSFINLYVIRRRVLTSKMLGMSHVYFPMFEELLDKYDLPLEFKYLAIVESALRPNAKSGAGATGLWQFMYPTGKMFGLQVTSYTDDRMDPYKSTEAACKYFKHLYKMYGNWELVMAAYNCGPGNVNKAIRRSGGAKDYWKLYPYLPRETRGYVPAFIAVNYAMNNASAHNIYPIAPLATFFEYDTVHVSENVTFKQLSEVLEVPFETIKFLNPRYKLNEVPYAGKNNFVYLPKDKIGKFIANDSLIYAYGEIPEEEKKKQEAERVKMVETLVTHKVRNGEYLGLIAQKYGVRVSDVKRWNHLKSNNLKIGQRLTIHTSPQLAAKKKTTPTKQSKPKQIVNGKYYTMQNGDTLWDIAKHQGVSYNDLVKLNTGTNFKKLKPGDKILISGS
jgi:membrane-bound lytic murein transglycosylase D